MVTLPDTTFTSSMPLSEVLVVMTKAEMLSICKKLELYVSPNVKKSETARRLAEEMLDQPLVILCTLCKNELQLAKDFVDAGPNAYLTRKMRKTFYKLQKYGLVLTYEDWEKHEWRMLMPDCVREVGSVRQPARSADVGGEDRPSAQLQGTPDDDNAGQLYALGGVE